MTGVRRRGFTILEMLMVIVMLGIMSAVATLAFRPPDVPRFDDPIRVLGDSEQRAVATGRAIVVRFMIEGKPASATVWPDGVVVADSVLDVERFTGLSTHARR